MKNLKEKNQKSENKPRKKIYLPIEKIIEERETGMTIEELAKRYNVSISTISNRIKEYNLEKYGRYSLSINKEKIISRSRLLNYLRLGVDVDKIVKFAEENNYLISEKHLEEAKEIQRTQLKTASKESISKIIQKYGYSYEELVKVAKHNGYVITKDRYDSAYKEINNNKENNKDKKGEDR